MPTSSRKRSRSSISRRISRAMWRSVSVSVDRREPLARRSRRQRGELVDRRPGHAHGERLGPQPRAVAARARPHAHELLDLLALQLGVGLAVAALRGWARSPRSAPRRRARARSGCGSAPRRARRRSRTGRRRAAPGQLAPRRLDVDPVALGERRGHLVVVGGARRRPRRDRALRDRELGVGHDELGVDLELRAQAGAVLRTSPAAR